MKKINKILIVIIIIISPIAVISFFKKETNFFNTPSNETHQKNNIIVKVNKNNVISEIPLEEYIIGVVSAEMPALFHDEALKAQAIAARTFALNKLNSSYYIETDTSDQAYLSVEELKSKWQDDFSKYYEKIKSAVEETKNMVLTYNNELIHAYYYAMSNGYTEDAQTVFNDAQPYLNILDSSWEKNLSNFSVTSSLSYDKFLQLLNLSNQEFSITNIKRNASNRIDSITINNQEFTGIEVRKKLSLRSTDFIIAKVNDTINITTKGYGHGVGMSQYGANSLANNNKSYQDILAYYYPNTKITNYIV